MIPQPASDRFLRAAVKTGLRLQRQQEAQGGSQGAASGIQTLRRIKASLQKRNSNRKTTP